MARLNISLTNKNFSRFLQSGSSNPPTSTIVLGGEFFQDSQYNYRVFKSSDQLTVQNGFILADALVIAGGGGGAHGYAGGGGAGGLVYVPQVSISDGSYTVLVGAGGATYTNGYQNGNNGSNSLISHPSIPTAIGGGYGAVFYEQGGSGGSGGGGGFWGGPGGYGTPGQGNNGGSGYYGGGGGGGAGSSGSGFDGGQGSADYSSWGMATNTGTLWNGTRYFAAGGDSEYSSSIEYGRTPAGNVGAQNTGSGGAGNSSGAQSGGSGIVIIRWPK